MAAPNNATNDVKITPKPVAIAQATPDKRPEPIEVAIVLRTFGPGIKTFKIKKPRAGIKLIICKFNSNILYI